MKGFTLLSAVALTTTVFVGAAVAQNPVPSASLSNESVRTVVVRERPQIYHVDLRGDFQPAGSQPDPYIFLQTMYQRLNDSGVGALSFFALATTAGDRVIGDDMVVLGGAADPGTIGYDTLTARACISEVSFLLLNTNTTAGTLNLEINIHPWDGVFANGALPAINTLTITDITIPAAPSGGFNLILITVPYNNLPIPKASWFTIRALPTSTVNRANLGWVIASSTPGTVSLQPGRGYFRASTPPSTVFTTLTSGSIFGAIGTGSFYLAVRGKHNFVGQVNMSALDARALPSDPLAFEFEDRDSAEEALRRNLVDVEVVNDSSPTPFTTRFTTYLDENGRFTLPVAGAIASIKVRRWDNGLAVAFSRPAGGWSTDVCNPTAASATMTFGDVNGDGIVDDADLLSVLFGFGSSE